MGYFGAGGKLFHEKNQKQKSCDTVILSGSASRIYLENKLVPDSVAQNETFIKNCKVLFGNCITGHLKLVQYRTIVYKP